MIVVRAWRNLSVAASARHGDTKQSSFGGRESHATNISFWDSTL